MSRATLTSLLAALLSSSCCVVPVVLLTVGFTSLEPFALLMQYRPITLGLSVLLLASSFYWVYRPAAQTAGQSDLCTPQTLRRSRFIKAVAARRVASACPSPSGLYNTKFAPAPNT